MKIAFIPTKVISFYSGNGINCSGGQIVSVNLETAERLLTDMPENWELKGDDPETKALQNKLAGKKVAKQPDENKAAFGGKKKKE